MKTVSKIALALCVCSCVVYAQSAPKGEFDFVQISDPQLGKGGMEHDVRALTTTVQLINNLNPPADFVVVSGDLIDTTKVGTSVSASLIPLSRDSTSLITAELATTT